MKAGVSGTVRRTPAFDGPEREALRRMGTSVWYPPGHIVFSAGEQADRVYFIEEGYVKIYRLDPRGREITVGGMRNPGEIMGLAETLTGNTRACFARAFTNVTLLILTRERFLDLLYREHRLAVRVAAALAVRLRAAESLVYNLVCRPVPGRLAVMLLKFGDAYGIRTEQGVRIGIPLTYGEIASIIGSTRQTVTSLMNALREEGCIAVEGRTITIKDTGRLSERAV